MRYQSISLVVDVMCIRIFRDHLNVLYTVDPICIVLSQAGALRRECRASSVVLLPFSLSTPDVTARRWPALITLPPLAKFQLVWRRLCEALLSSSLARQKHPFLLSRPCLNAGDVKVVLP